MAVENNEENTKNKEKFWETILAKFFGKNKSDTNSKDTEKESKNSEKDGSKDFPQLDKKEDENLSPETCVLLDENFWIDATPQKVQDLISRGANVNAENKKGMTAAHYAALHGDVAIIKVLGENGADMNHGDIKAETPAHKVAKNEQSNDVLKELAKYNADFNQTNIYGESPKEMIQKNQQDAPTLLKEIEEIQQHKEKDSPKKEGGLNNTLTAGSQEGENDSRNELNNTHQKNNKTTNPALLNSQKDY